MKPFNLDEYLRLKEEGKEPKLVTRIGYSVRIICTDCKTGDSHTIVGLVEKEEHETVIYFTNDGRYHDDRHESYLDIFFATTKHEGWINIYRGANYNPFGDTVFDSESVAKENIYQTDHKEYITTIKIEWED